MESIWSCRSTNGRWGAQIVSDCPLGGGWPAQGELQSLGRAAGVACFRFVADAASGTWVLPWTGSGSVVALEGASLAYQEELQSGRSGAILLLGRTALIQRFGYKERGSRYKIYCAGVAQDAPPSVLLALGLIQPEAAPEPVPAPPQPSEDFAEALRAATELGARGR